MQKNYSVFLNIFFKFNFKPIQTQKTLNVLLIWAICFQLFIIDEKQSVENLSKILFEKKKKKKIKIITKCE